MDVAKYLGAQKAFDSIISRHKGHASLWPCELVRPYEQGYGMRGTNPIVRLVDREVRDY